MLPILAPPSAFTMWFIFINSGLDLHFHTFYMFMSILRRNQLKQLNFYLPASRVSSEISKVICKPSIDFMKSQLHLWWLANSLNEMIWWDVILEFAFFLNLIIQWESSKPPLVEYYHLLWFKIPISLKDPFKQSEMKSMNQNHASWWCLIYFNNFLPW